MAYEKKEWFSGETVTASKLNRIENGIDILYTNLDSEIESTSLLKSRVDQIVAPTGEAPSAAEVTDARVGADGTTYDSVGNAIRTQVADLNSAIKSTTATVITNTASGATVSFPDGADDIPVDDLTVSMEPIQDLHGYDNPWPAGGGKNKLLLDGTSKTESGITFTFNNDVGTITVNGTATAVVTAYSYWELSAGDYTYTSGITETYTTIDTYISSGNNTIARGNNNAPGPNFSFSGGRAAITVRIREGFVANNLVIKPMVRLQTVTDDTFEPYSNICPISGFTRVNVHRTGKNLLSPQELNETSNGVTISSNDGVYTLSGSATSYAQFVSGTTFSLKKGTYTLFGNKSASDPKTSVQLRSVDGLTIYANSAENPVAFTLSEDAEVKFRVATNVGNVDGLTLRPQLELGSTATSYEPYTGNTYSVTFPTEAGTVYGGTLDVVTGELVVDRAMVTMTGADVIQAQKEGSMWRIQTSALGDRFVGANVPYSISNKYSYAQEYTSINQTNNSYGFSANIGQMFIHDDTFTSLDEIKASLNSSPLKIVYTLATPQTYQLTPQEVRTLLGTNNVWSDGDVEVTYKADTKLYIDQKLATVIANALNS